MLGLSHAHQWRHKAIVQLRGHLRRQDLCVCGHLCRWDDDLPQRHLCLPRGHPGLYQRIAGIPERYYYFIHTTPLMYMHKKWYTNMYVCMCFGIVVTDFVLYSIVFYCTLFATDFVLYFIVLYFIVRYLLLILYCIVLYFIVRYLLLILYCIVLYFIVRYLLLTLYCIVLYFIVRYLLC